MEQSPQTGEARTFAPLAVPLAAPLDGTAPLSGASPAPASSAASSRGFVLEEIVDPWQPGRAADRSAGNDLVDPWRESSSVSNDPELIDPWRNEVRVASLDAPVAAFDWDTSPPELLNPWPTAAAPLSYDLPELIDPWSTTR